MTPEDAIEILEETGYTDRELDFYEALDMAINALQELPKRRKEAKRWKTKALSAQPVKHGEWEQHDGCVLCEDDDTYFYTCSCCKMAITEAERGLFNYCPNCGAKMDKEKNGNIE